MTSEEGDSKTMQSQVRAEETYLGPADGLGRYVGFRSENGDVVAEAAFLLFKSERLQYMQFVENQLKNHNEVKISRIVTHSKLGPALENPSVKIQRRVRSPFSKSECNVNCKSTASMDILPL